MMLLLFGMNIKKTIMIMKKVFKDHTGITPQVTLG